MADNETDCRENAAVKKAPGDVVIDLFDNLRLLTEFLSLVRAANDSDNFVQQ
jgi:hypothetical protein